MPKTILDIRSYVPRPDELFLLDTSVLIHIFTEMNIGSQRAKSYISFFDNVLMKQKIKPCITALILSELINRYIRFHFDVFRTSENEPKANFKTDYRITLDYEEKIKLITNIVREDIIPYFIQTDDMFSDLNVESLLSIDTYYDFNDKITAVLGQRKGLTIITDDSDFGQMKDRPTILTANPRLLRFL